MAAAFNTEKVMRGKTSTGSTTKSKNSPADRSPGAAGSHTSQSRLSPPVWRRLRGCAFDPSLPGQLDTAIINEYVLSGSAEIRSAALTRPQ